jgi:hypothetical protein
VLDLTGLLYYHARMYDPNLGRFVSADSVVPGSASGSMDGVALRPLTVDFHEPGFVSSLNSENQQGFWFQMSNEQRQKAGSPWGPANPQALNRYSYVQNNPLKYTDPTGHTVYLSKEQAASFSRYLVQLADLLTSNEGHPSQDALDLAKNTIRWASGALLRVIRNLIETILGDPKTLRWKKISKIRELSDRIDEVNAEGSLGVAIGGGANAGYDYNIWVMNRSNGKNMKQVEFGWFLYFATFGGDSIFNIGAAYVGKATDGWHFVDDADGKYFHSDTCPEDSTGC